MKLTLDRLIDLHRGISALDAGHEITVDGKSARRPFKYSATVHFPLQQNAAAILPHFQAWEKANKALFNQNAESYLDDKGQPAQRVKVDRLSSHNAESQKLLDQVVTVKLYRVTASEMKIGTGEGENPIPTVVLNWLRPILNDDRAKDQLVEVKDEDEPPATTGEAKA